MTKLATSTAKRIISDWSNAFPGFDIWKPLWLLRRIGPVVQGIILARSSSGEDYFPTTHVHALTREFPVVSLMLSHRLAGNNGVQERLSFARHEKDFPGVADRLAAQSELSLSTAPSIDEIVRAYHSYAIAQKGKGLPAVNEIEDSINVAAVTGQTELVREGFQIATHLANEWAKPRLPLGWTTAGEWLDSLRNSAANTSALASTVDEQIAKHRLGKVRVA